MKKRNGLIIFIMVISFALIFLNSCQRKKEQEALNKLTNYVYDYYVPSETNQNITLLETDGEITITWESNNKQVLSNTGEVNRQQDDSLVTLKGTFKYQEQTIEKTYQIKIIKLPIIEPQPIDILTDWVNKYQLPNEVTNDINFVDPIEGMTISWDSSNEEVITNTGRVTQQTEDIIVSLIGTFNYKDNILKKTFNITVIKKEIDPDLQELTLFLNTFTLPNETKSNLDLSINSDKITVSWDTSNRDVIMTNGNIKRGTKNKTAVLTGFFRLNDQLIKKSFSITVLAYTDQELVIMAKDTIELPSHITENLELPEIFSNNVIGVWHSSNELVINSKGIFNPSTIVETITLTVDLQLNDYIESFTYEVTTKAYSNLERLNDCLNKIVIPTIIQSSIELVTNYEGGIIATWQSDHPEVLDNNGTYYQPNHEVTIKLTLILSLGDDFMEKEYQITTLSEIQPILNKEHQVIVRSTDMEKERFYNLQIEDGKLVLSNGFLEGTYESSEIATKLWSTLVASWAAISSKEATVELQVKAKIDGVWSNYISYSAWGLGLENKCIDQNVNLIKLVDDEVMVTNSKLAESIMFKVTLRRKTIMIDSPKLSLVSFALLINNYQYKIDSSILPQQVDYDVPKLYQQAVPEIGGEICSATSTTMLLKYHGLDFSAYDTYEHRYIAYLVRDYGNNIFGNWVYNTVTIGAYGFNAYVARFYSLDELMYHLAFVGPVAISVKGQMTSDLKNYYTSGHLLVIRGYYYDNDKLVFIANDPNVANVRCEYSADIIKTTWRNICYVIE